MFPIVRTAGTSTRFTSERPRGLYSRQPSPVKKGSCLMRSTKIWARNSRSRLCFLPKKTRSSSSWRKNRSFISHKKHKKHKKEFWFLFVLLVLLWLKDHSADCS